MEQSLSKINVWFIPGLDLFQKYSISQWISTDTKCFICCYGIRNNKSNLFIQIPTSLTLYFGIIIFFLNLVRGQIISSLPLQKKTTKNCEVSNLSLIPLLQFYILRLPPLNLHFRQTHHHCSVKKMTVQIQNRHRQILKNLLCARQAETNIHLWCNKICKAIGIDFSLWTLNYELWTHLKNVLLVYPVFQWLDIQLFTNLWERNVWLCQKLKSKKKIINSK